MLGIPLERRSGANGQRAAAILEGMGYKRKQGRWSGGKQVWGYILREEENGSAMRHFLFSLFPIFLAFLLVTLVTGVKRAGNKRCGAGLRLSPMGAASLVTLPVTSVTVAVAPLSGSLLQACSIFSACYGGSRRMTAVFSRWALSYWAQAASRRFPILAGTKAPGAVGHSLEGWTQYCAKRRTRGSSRPGHGTRHAAWLSARATTA